MEVPARECLLLALAFAATIPVALAMIAMINPETSARAWSVAWVSVGVAAFAAAVGLLMKCYAVRKMGDHGTLH